MRMICGQCNQLVATIVGDGKPVHLPLLPKKVELVCPRCGAKVTKF